MQYDDDDQYPQPPTPQIRRADSRHEDDGFHSTGERMDSLEYERQSTIFVMVGE